MNSVTFILKNRPLNYEDKLKIMRLGRPTPELTIKKCSSGKKRQFNRYFNGSIYDKYRWMCGCWEKNKLFCFVCLMSSSLQPNPWMQEGVDDLQHLMERATKHEKSTTHLHHLIDYSLLDKSAIQTKLDSGYLQTIRTHNNQVDKNRRILRRLITCIKFCGAFELAPRSHEETFRSLVDFMSELDSVLALHLEESPAFQRISLPIQDQLLEAMLQVCKNEIRNQIRESNFLAIEADEASDSYNQEQLVVIFRYVFEGEIFERFWDFIRPESPTPEAVAAAIIHELDDLGIPVEKLIAQSYDGGAIISGVQSLVREKYRNASYVHSYAHHFYQLLENGACGKKMKIFFAEVRAFGSFFSQSAKRRSLLEEIAKRSLPKLEVRWDFKTKTVNTLYDNRSIIRECLDSIVETERDPRTISEANSFLRNLDCNDFNYFLQLIHYIFPFVETFFNQIQDREADSAHLHNCLENFELEISEIRKNKIDKPQDPLQIEESEGPSLKRARITDDVNRVIPKEYSEVAKEYCDMIVTQIRDRFTFSGHSSAAKLFSSGLLRYEDSFPENILRDTVECYDFLDGEKLRTELKVIYQREDMRCDGILPLLTFLNKNGLQEGLSETYKLLDIICTVPMTTHKSERCFTTLERIKSFMRNTVGQEKLNALTMLSVERKLVQSIPDFDNKVINLFASTSKERRTDFNYK